MNMNINLEQSHFTCNFCKGNHYTKICPIESKLSPLFKNLVGFIMEHHFCKFFSCPGCQNNTLKVLNNNNPSLDIICTNCNKKIEIKSKCLSSNIIPKDIICQSGNYTHFIKNINDINLDLIIIIYGVNRKKKEIYIRKIIYAPNSIILNTDIIKIIKRYNSSLSLIYINDIDKLINILINSNKIITFKNLLNKISICNGII